MPSAAECRQHAAECLRLSRLTDDGVKRIAQEIIRLAFDEMRGGSR
jgi:hypothetical protein